MYNFLNSNLFQTIVTFVVGSIAILLYFWQKRDYKKKAAKIILIEIQNAESVIEKIKDSLRRNQLETDELVMPNDSWSLYKHLFSKNFDHDEWNLISKFYNKGKLLDEAIIYNNSAFANDVEQIRTNKQRTLAEFAKELLVNVGNSSGKTDVNTLINSFDQKVKLFDQIYMDKQKDFVYAPQKPINDARKYLEDFVYISTSVVGEKLKKIAR